MDLVPSDLLVFLTRWLHVICGIMWIGNSFYFMWLDANIASSPDDHEDVEGALWMVHSGGFYQVQKRKIRSGEMPAVLHWFKWEATLTWVTGFFMLAMVFYLRKASLMLDPNVADLSPTAAIATSIGILITSWVVYDLLWISPVANKSKVATYAVSIVLLLGLIFGCCSLFSGRGAFIHIGAVFGTLMVLNVWVRILPAQSAMIAATERGERADFSLGLKAKSRSVHNSYLTLPVLFTMFAGHLPAATTHTHLAGIIALFIAFGIAVRHVMILQVKGGNWKPWLVPTVVLLAVLAGLLNFKPPTAGATVSGLAQVSDEQAIAIVQQRCVSCHAKDPVDTELGKATIFLETLAEMKQFADRMKLMAVDTEAMPLVNKTQMTKAERERLGHWIQGVLTE